MMEDDFLYDLHSRHIVDELNLRITSVEELAMRVLPACEERAAMLKALDLAFFQGKDAIRRGQYARDGEAGQKL